LIFEKYKNFIDKNTYFYKTTPLSLELSPTSLSLKVKSMDEMLIQSISCINDIKIKDKNSTIIYSSKDKLYFNDKDIVLNIKGNRVFNKLYYKGEYVAKVVENEFDEKLDITKLHIRFKNRYFYLLETDPKFYIKTPRLNINKLNIKDMVSGDKLILLNDIDKKTKIKNNYDVKLYNSMDFQKGLSIIFDSQIVNKDEKILYKNIEVGYIKKIYLDGMKRKAVGFIYDRYKKLIDDDTKFYKLQDLDLDISLEGVDVSVGSFKQLYKGGISFEVSNNPKAKLTKQSFNIYKNIKALEKANPKVGLRVTIISDDSKNISMKAPVYYKYFQIGYIENIKLNTTTNKIETTVYIESKYKKYITSATKFYLNSVVDIEFGLFNSKINIGNLTSLIKGGFSIKIDNTTKQKVTDKKVYKLIIPKKD